MKFDISKLGLGALAVLAMAVSQAAQAQNIFTATYSTGFIDIDPSSANSNEVAVLANIYEPLIWYTPGMDGAEASLEPGLATSWSVSEDELSWTFNLREGVEFSDGTPFNSEAVKYSIQRTQGLDMGSAWIWWMVEDIETPDPMTAVFKLTDPAPIDLIASSAYAAWMISPAVGDKDGTWFNEGNAAGTGPFTLRSYEAGSQAVLQRNSNYWGDVPEGGIDIAILENVEDSVLREQKLLGGQTDWTENLETDNLDAIDAAEGAMVTKAPSFENFFGMFNTQKAPLDQVEVRQALSMAFPYDQFINNVLGGTVSQARGIVPFGMPGHAAGAKQYSFDAEAAKAMLDAAGVSDLELTLTYTAGIPEPQKAAELYKAALAEIGVTLNIKPLAWEAQYEMALSGPENAQDIFTMSWWPTYVVAYDFLATLFHTEEESNFNLSYYSNPAFDDAINDANALLASDQAAAFAGWAKAGEMLVEDAPALFIYDTQKINGVREDIKGFAANPGYSGVVFLNKITR